MTLQYPVSSRTQAQHIAAIKKQRGLGSLGVVNPSAGDAMRGASVGATAGSIVPGVGTAIGAAVGAAVGAVVGLLGARPNTAAHLPWANQLSSAIGSLPSSAAGIGRQIPWNENNHGLVQFIEALMASGIYMAWDTSILSNYDVCAHWAMTFGTAVQVLTNAIVTGAANSTLSVTISEQPGANHGPINFTFLNPGIGVGPDAISARVIMGSSGLMYAMIAGLGETAAHASSNASNALAQKVFALMVDNIAASLAPQAAQPTTPAPVVAPAVIAASQAANAAVAAPVSQTTNPVPQLRVQPAVQPAVDNSAAMMQQMLAEGASQNAAMLAAMQQLQSQGVNSQAPAVQQQLQSALPSSGISTSTMLLFGGVALAAILLLKKG